MVTMKTSSQKNAGVRRLVSTRENQLLLHCLLSPRVLTSGDLRPAKTLRRKRRRSQLLFTCSGEGGAYLQAAEADHAVHHLGDTETVAEVVEGVVFVVVMDTQLWRHTERERGLSGSHDHQTQAENQEV